MGLFSKRRSKGFDPDLWSDAKDRAKGKSDEPWFAGLDEAGDDPALDDLTTNAGAKFDDSDDEWLKDDPGEQVRKRES